MVKRFFLDLASTLSIAFGLLIAVSYQVQAQVGTPVPPVGMCTNSNCKWSGAEGGCVGVCTENGPQTCSCTAPPILINGVPCYCEAS